MTDRARTPVNPRLAQGAVLGAVVGLTWAAALRAWMSQLAGAATTSTWTTVLLVLLPGAAVGALLRLAGARRSMGLRHRRALVWAPVLFATALLDPAIFRLLITTGEGSGALMVVATALTGGVVLSRGRWTFGRILCAVVWSMGMLLLFFIGTMPAPLSTPLGAWVCLFGGSLMAVLSFGAALPHPHGIRGGDALLPWVGAVTGLAWASGLRGFMSEVIGDESAVSWIGTFGFVLVPGTAIGALLGWAELQRRRGRPRRFLVWSPVLFAAVLVPGLADPATLFEGGVGGGAIGVPLISVIGAYAVAGRRQVVRRAGAVVFIAALAVWVLTATTVGGQDFALDTPYGVWTTALYYGLLVTAALATSIPLRAQPQTRPRDGSARIVATSAR
ncbi:MAG TPA: hypothetical protein VLA55_06205 [Ornithinibacter sp.]|nr:hypothetical protein [Ornithinibacter sp.]